MVVECSVKNGDRIMAGGLITRIKSNTPHQLTAAKESDAQYYLEQQAERMTRCRNVALPVLESVRRHADIVARLHQDGFVILRDFFSPDLIRGLGSSVEKLVRTRRKLTPIRAHSQESISDLEEGTYRYLSNHDVHEEWEGLEVHVSAVGIQDPLINLDQTPQLVFDAGLLEMATAFYGAVPLVTFLKIRYAFGNNFPPADTQFFHVDGGSYRIFKALIYLNDVGEGCGPFCYVKGSHRVKWNGWDQKARYDDIEIEDIYGAESIARCYAKAGDVILADTTGVHRGEKPVNADRGILIVNYCIHPEYGFDHPDIRIMKRDRETLGPFGRLAAEHLVEVDGT